jgi:uncharacterized RDD family membrane protein YckC
MFVALPGIEGASTAETEMTPEQKKKFGESRVAALAMIYDVVSMPAVAMGVYLSGAGPGGIAAGFTARSIVGTMGFHALAQKSAR